jgi:dipeptidyl aminopeptidase/acylaminoacyl peptidase
VKKVLLLIFTMLLVMTVAPANAQSTDNIVLVYNNLDDSLVLYNGGEVSELILADQTRRYEYQLAMSPTNNHVAVYTVSFTKGALNNADYSTHTYNIDIFTLPGGDLVLNRSLLPESYVPRTGAATETPGDQTYELPLALGEMVWSPDGSQLAFVEGVDGGAATVQIFDTADESLTEVSEEEGYPTRLRWSPDSEKLAYDSVETFLSENGPTSAGVFIASADGSETVQATIEEESQFTWVLDWVDEERFLWSPFDPIGGAMGLYLYDSESDSSTALVDPEQAISPAKWDATTETIAFAVPVFSREEDAPAQSGLAPGAYTVSLDGDTPEQLIANDNLYGVSVPLPGYLNVGNDVIFQLTSREEISLSELRRPDFSPDGEFALGERTSQTYLRDLSSNEEDLIVNLFYVDGFWLDNESFVAQVGAYGSVIGVGRVNGSFTNLVENVSRDSPFVGFRTE